MTIEQLNDHVRETFGGNYTVKTNGIKYALLDDDFEFTFPLLITNNQAEIIKFLNQIKTNNATAH